MTDNTPSPSRDICANIPQTTDAIKSHNSKSKSGKPLLPTGVRQTTTEDVRIPMKEPPSSESGDGNAYWYVIHFVVGLIISLVFSFLALIALGWIEDKRKRQFYATGCSIGIVFSIGIYIGLVLVLIGNKWWPHNM